MADLFVPAGGVAAVIGTGGGIGAAMAAVLAQSGAFAQTIGFTRSGTPALDITSEDSGRTLGDGVFVNSFTGGETKFSVVIDGVADKTAPQRLLNDLRHPAGSRLCRQIIRLERWGLVHFLRGCCPKEAACHGSKIGTEAAMRAVHGNNRLGAQRGARAQRADSDKYAHRISRQSCRCAD